MRIEKSPVLSGYANVGPRVHHVVALAEALAQARGHGSVGVPHLLLGILDEGQGLAVTAIQVHGVSIASLRADVERLLPPIGTAVANGAHLELAPDARAVFAAASAEVKALDHQYLATEHLLVGLLSDQHAPVARLLVARGFGVTEARARIRWLFESDPLDVMAHVSPHIV